MEVITIDSSDDEDVLTSWAEQGRSSRSAAISSSQAKQPRHFVPIVTPRESQIIQPNDCSSSVSSADSIWDKVGLPSRPRRVIEDVLVISDDECSDSSGDCCITTTAASQQPLSSQTQANQSDESTVSSNDSIWFKAGLPSRRDRDRRGDVSPNALESLQFDDTRHDRLKNIRKEDNDNADQTADNILRVDSECSDCSSIIDCCIVAPLDGKQTHVATSYDDSFISSDDSMWDKIGSALKVDDDECSECSDCSISRDRAVTASLDGKQTRDAINIDDSSISSSDSILNKVGLPSRRTPLRIETYYDYFRLKPSGGDINDTNQKTSEAINNPVHSEGLLPPEVPLPVDATWRIVLLMDHREFGCANNYLQTVEAKINNHFGGGTFSEITTLPSADYLYVARLISDTTGEIMDERVLDMVIERKNVIDVCSCLITDSKKYKPLSFFDAQMYKLQTCGVSKKLFLMEGDEDRARNFFSGAKSHMEKERRLKRVKTLRMQLDNAEFEGVDIICTRNRLDTVKFLIQQLESFLQSFNPRRPPTKTRQQLKLHIEKQMKAPTLHEYLRLRKIPGIGDAKAMKVIMDPNLHWSKSFISPSSSKKAKSTLEDRATFWRPIPKKM